VNIDALAALPQGTLGHAYATFLRRYSLRPSDLPEASVLEDHDYVIKHIHQTHDLHHVLLDMKPNVDGETGVQAFYVAQLSLPFSSFIVALSFFLSALFSARGMDRSATYASQGWLIGKNARPVFGIDWRLYWERPLDDVRAELGIVPFAGHPTDAYYRSDKYTTSVDQLTAPS
jgi:ubiquinone biosynthesis protein Coq4